MQATNLRILGWPLALLGAALTLLVLASNASATAHTCTFDNIRESAPDDCPGMNELRVGDTIAFRESNGERWPSHLPANTGNVCFWENTPLDPLTTPAQAWCYHYFQLYFTPTNPPGPRAPVPLPPGADCWTADIVTTTKYTETVTREGIYDWSFSAPMASPTCPFPQNRIPAEIGAASTAVSLVPDCNISWTASQPTRNPSVCHQQIDYCDGLVVFHGVHTPDVRNAIGDGIWIGSCDGPHGRGVCVGIVREPPGEVDMTCVNPTDKDCVVESSVWRQAAVNNKWVKYSEFCYPRDLL